MPGAWTSHAAEVLNAQPDIDVGIHLTLTSEWDRVKWRPLTQANGLVDRHGNFLPMLTPRGDSGAQCLASANWSIDEIANEFRAQVSLGVRMFRNASHISSHMLRHFSDFDAQLGDIIAELCHEFGLKDDAFGHGLPRIEGYPKFPRDTEVRIDAFARQLEALEAGTYIFIDHPAVASPELSAMGHHGYDDVAEDRTTCLETLTSSKLRACIADLSISLISYRDL